MVRQCLKPECWRHNILYIAIQYRAAGSMLNQYIGVIFSIVLWSHDSPPPPFMDLGMTLRNVGKSAKNLQSAMLVSSAKSIDLGCHKPTRDVEGGCGQRGQLPL